MHVSPIHLGNIVHAICYNWRVSKQCDLKQSQTLFCSLSLIVCIPGQLDLYKSGCNCNDNDKRVQGKLLIEHKLH